MIITKISQLFSLTGGNISPQEAIIRMAKARWDYQVAVNTYLEDSKDLNSLSLSSPSRVERDRDQDNIEEQGKSVLGRYQTARKCFQHRFYPLMEDH